MMAIQTNVLFYGGGDMAAITILLVLGICVFLVWFFNAMLKDFAEEDRDSEVIDLRVKRRTPAPVVKDDVLAERPRVA